MQEYLVEVICDTSFLIHLATKRIKNIDNLNMEIGQVSFVVPQVVQNELTKLIKNTKKNQDITITIDFIKNFKILPMTGNFADKELIDYVKKNHAIIGTMDKELKKKIKEFGGSVMSFSNNKIILES
ncbi:PilT protein domain protein [metagenome]